ncbi:MAG: T9SS type A sorting domain-containing protein [Bacteroidales bacterium]|jgi:hypothetical protein
MEKIKNTTGAFFIFLMLQGFTLYGQRITVSGNEFRLNDEHIWLNGTNTPWDNWNDFGGSFEYDWWDNEFGELQDLHINCTRVWITCDGNNAGIDITDEGFINGVNSTFWSHVDQLMEIAQSKQVYLMVALISFDHTKPGNQNAEKWINMYNSSVNRQSFVDSFAVPFVNRYKDNPYFFAVDVGNELEWVWENHGVASGNVIDLIARVADAVKANSEVLVCQGWGAGIKYNTSAYGGSGNYLADVNVDFYNIHYYDWQNQWFGNPFDLSPADYEMHSKPCIIGEVPAIGAAGYTPLECYQKAYKKGWDGMMVWTSNGVDGNGDKWDAEPGSDYIWETYQNLVTGMDNITTHNRNKGFRLYPNTPNPFTASTTIQFSLPEPGNVQIRIYNMKGDLVKTLVDDHYLAGNHSVIWNGPDNPGDPLSTGIYFCSLYSGDFSEIKKMLVIP